MTTKTVQFRAPPEFLEELNLLSEVLACPVSTVLKLGAKMMFDKYRRDIEVRRLKNSADTPPSVPVVTKENTLLKKLRKDPEVCSWVKETYAHMAPETKRALAQTEVYDALLKELTP